MRILIVDDSATDAALMLVTLRRHGSGFEDVESKRVDTEPDLRAALREALRRYRHPWLHRVQRHAVGQVARVRRVLAGGA